MREKGAREDGEREEEAGGKRGRREKKRGGRGRGTYLHNIFVHAHTNTHTQYKRVQVQGLVARHSQTP